MEAGTAPRGAKLQPKKITAADLADLRRRAKRVQSKAGSFARELAQLEERCEEFGITFVIGDVAE